MENLEFKGLKAVFGYLPSGTPNRRTHSGGYKRRVSVQSKSRLFHRSRVSDQPFRTARRYFISRMHSYVGRSVGPMTPSTSALRRSNTSGWIERRNTTNVSVEAVCKTRLVPWSRARRRSRTVSRPARRILKISSRKTSLSGVFQSDKP